jgi:hypothetical protein
MSKANATPRELVVQIAREQNGFPPSRAVCIWCQKPGATDPHHWLFKRSSGVSLEVLHNPANVVLLHHHCHQTYGQTKAMTLFCLGHKINLGYDIAGWIDKLLEQGLIKHRPDIGGNDGQGT